LPNQFLRVEPLVAVVGVAPNLGSGRVGAELAATGELRSHGAAGDRDRRC
jgi:hypothetical protein